MLPWLAFTIQGLEQVILIKWVEYSVHLCHGTSAGMHSLLSIKYLKSHSLDLFTFKSQLI